MTEIELAIRKAHIINWALFCLNMILDKLSLTQTDLRNYLFLSYTALIEEKRDMKALYKKHDIKLLAADKDLRAVFNEAENLAKSSFPHRALGFITAVRPDWCDIKKVLSLNNDPSLEEDIRFSHQMFKDMLENPND
jgi:hypothetical protein